MQAKNPKWTVEIQLKDETRFPLLNHRVSINHDMRNYFCVSTLPDCYPVDSNVRIISIRTAQHTVPFERIPKACKSHDSADCRSWFFVNDDVRTEDFAIVIIQ